MQDIIVAKQIDQCVELLKQVFGHQLLGIYLYGSAVYGGLQKYSDLDLFVVSERETTAEQKKILTTSLLQISGLYMAHSNSPIELTTVVKSGVNPWHYPPKFDYQYGEWLRNDFEKGIVEPWPSKVMPDLAILITKVRLAHKTLYGSSPDELLSPVPYRDFILATASEVKNLMADLHTDTRNVLLAYARIWSTLVTNTIRPKPDAALWANNHLPNEYQPVITRARSICMGEVKEHWNDISQLIQPCAEFMLNQINNQVILIEQSGYEAKSINLDHSS